MTLPKDMIGFVRITKAPAPFWVGVEGPLRVKSDSEPMIPDGKLVFGEVPNPDPAGPAGGAFFPVDPNGEPDWDFELLRRFSR